jgi:hypothetical protein
MESANEVLPSMAKSDDRNRVRDGVSQKHRRFEDAFAKTRLFPTEQPAHLLSG